MFILLFPSGTGKTFGNSCDQLQMAILIYENNSAAITGYIFSKQISLDTATPTTCEMNRFCVTFCSGETFLYFLHRRLNL